MYQGIQYWHINLDKSWIQYYIDSSYNKYGSVIKDK